MEQPIRRIFLIHGWEGRPDNHWFPWLSRALGEYGFSVFVPAMPNTANPKISEWIEHLQHVVVKPDEDTYFVGHSIGCQAILRFLEKLPASQKVGGAVFVGGWFTLMNLETQEEKDIAKPWLGTLIDFEKVKRHTKKFIAIFSDDDKSVPLENKGFFEERLGAKTVVEHQKGHFCKSDGVTELPSALSAVLDLADLKALSPKP